MDTFIRRYCVSLLLLTSIATSAGSNETKDVEPREPRVTGRIVKLYSGAKPEPYLCTGEGFRADPMSCSAFYRCVKERSGKFTVFRYQCAPGTVYDPDLETCNHPHSTRRIECGGTLKSTSESYLTTNINDIDGAQSEIPKPISTKLPVYTEQTSIKNPTTLSWILSTERQPANQMSWTSTPLNSPSTQIITSTKVPVSNNQWLFSTQQWESQYTSKTTATPIQASNSKNNEPCTSDGFMGDSKNCRKFYRCVGNQRGGYIKYEFSCSESTVWDDEIQGCNHPWAVKRSKCGRSLSYDDKSTPRDAEAHSTEVTTMKQPNANNEEFGKKTNKTIQQQLQISHGSKVTQTQTQISYGPDVIQNQTQINYGDKMPNTSNSKQNQTQISYGTAVSQAQTQINYGNKGMQTQLQIDHSKDSSQSQVQIIGSTSTTKSTASVPVNNNGNNKCSESGFMGDSEDCKKFYRCVDNGRGSYTKYEYSCGEGTVWDQEIEACNHAWAVKHCGGKQPGSSSTGIQTSTTETQTTTAKTTEYHTEHTKTTQSYITSSVPDTDDEDDVGYGSQNNQEATSSSTTVPQITTTTVKSTTNHQPTSIKPNTGTECTTSGFMGDANDCKIFYRCVDNGNNGFTKYEFKCGDGTVWDPDIEACNHAWAVKNCGGSLTGSDQKEETTTKKENTTPSQSTHTTVTLVQITTEAPTQDDDYDTGYGSQNQQPTTVSSSTTSKSETQSEEHGTSSNCQASGFMGDENDCKKFYRCVDNGNGGFIKYEFTCGQGTVWDPKIDACNHAWAVEKCGGSNNNNENESESSSQSSLITTASDDNSVQTTQVSKGTDKPSTTDSITTNKSPTTTSGKDNKCTNSSFMGDNSDCKKFYRCVDNGDGSFTRYEFTCGEGTVWDPKIEACNHAWAVEKCGHNTGSTSTYEPQQTSSQHPVIQDEEETGYGTPSYETSTLQTTSGATLSSTTAPSQSKPSVCTYSGFMGDKNDCKKFYRCVDNGKGGYDRYEFQCGEGTAWDQNIEACNHAREVEGCGDSAPNTTYTHPEQTTTFHQESTSQHTITTTGTVENIESTGRPEGSKGTCNSEGFYANPSDCKKFYRCVANGNGGYTKYDFICGDGTVWNQEIQGCDHESSDKSCASTSSTQHTPEKPQHTTESQFESTTSSSSTTIKHETTVNTDTSQITNQCKSEGFMAHPNNCKKFIRCVDNGNGGFTQYEFSCGDGTVWVQEIQACDHDNDVNSCSPKGESTSQAPNTESSSSTEFNPSSTTSSSTTSSTESTHLSDQYDPQTPNKPSHDELDDCTSEGYFPNKEDCKKFYRCVDNGKGSFTKYDFVCGEGTAWDNDLQTCNHINEVESCSGSNSENNGNQPSTTNNNQAGSESTTQQSTTKTTTSSSSSSSSGPNSQDKCESEGYFGDSNDCKKFFRCVDNGKGGYTKYDYTCGEGTIWDQDITTCNHPQDVSNPSCGSSQESSGTSSTTSSTTASSQTTSSTTEGSSTTQNTSDCSQESSKNPTNNNVTCDKAGYYANPNDCKKFYRCVDWDGDGKRFSVFHFECGEGTIWDPALDTCNHEDSVYPPRDCSQTQSQNGSGESTTSDGSTTSTTASATSEQTTQESSSEQTTTQQITSENTTTEQSNEPTTTQQSTTSETTTQQSTTSEQTTTQQSTTSEQTTTQQSTTSEQTTTQQSTTSEQTTTQQSTTTEQTTTQQSGTSEQTTTEQTTTSEQTTAQQTTTTQQTTTQETLQTTTQQTTSTEQTTTQQSSSGEQTTTGQSTTNEQTTTQQSTTEEQTTTQQATTEQTTATQETSTTEQTTTQQSTTNEQTTAQQSTTTEQTTTQESTTNSQTTTTDDSTSTEEATQQSTTSENTTTEQSSESTTEQSSTTEQATDGTTEATTDGTSTEGTTDQTTTQSSSTESDSTGEPSPTTETSSTDKECPETEDDQYLLVCPTSFRRHPKYCNMFYQCTEEDDTYEAKVAMFKCPNNTIYDESQTQCVTENKADKKCNGEIANKRRFKRKGANYKEPILADNSKHQCSSTGYFPFEKHSECAKGFLKCEKSKNGEMRGYVYQCPDGYVYWSISKRCERLESVRDCKRSSNDWTGRWNIPVERKNVAIR